MRKGFDGLDPNHRGDPDLNSPAFAHESVEPAELTYWRDLTALPDHFQLNLFDGDHFFLNGQRRQLLAAIARLLTQSNRRAPRSRRC
jgi:surfactin synthase thioesterase subunit